MRCRPAKRWALAIAVTAMRLMTRYTAFPARPIASWVARHEVIACGMRLANGEVRIIYTPGHEGTAHTVELRTSRERRQGETLGWEDYSR